MRAADIPRHEKEKATLPCTRKDSVRLCVTLDPISHATKRKSYPSLHTERFSEAVCDIRPDIQRHQKEKATIPVPGIF